MSSSVHSELKILTHLRITRISNLVLQEQDADADMDAPIPEHAPTRPQTRQELQELRARYANNQTMAQAFYGDLALQADLKILWLGSEPLVRAYQHTLDVHKEGQDFWRC